MRSSLQLGVLAAALLLAGAQAPAHATVQNAQTTAHEIANTLQVKGAAATIGQYFNCENGSGYAFVSGGDPAAVSVAARILPQADACVAGKLQSSLRLALIYNPAVVLPFVNSAPQLSAAEICKPVDLPADAPTSHVATTAQEMEGSLGVVSSPALAAKKQACLRVISGS